MVGPGTGVAPFRAFLFDRKATGATGKNWLFFGHQRSDCDFFYRDELNALKTSGLLTRLSLAWSRDGEKKFYVQDRMSRLFLRVSVPGQWPLAGFETVMTVTSPIARDFPHKSKGPARGGAFAI